MKKVEKKKIGLGKGLSGLGLGALYGVNNKAQLKEKSTGNRENATIGKIKIEYIEVNPFQPRHDFNEDALNELRDSIEIHGVIQPITVRKISVKSYQIISGERRFRASQLAGLTEIPAYIRESNDQEMREIALIENIQREDLNAIEVALTYQSLISEVGLKHEELAERVGKSRTGITNYLRLLKLPPEIQNGLKSKKISMGHARALLSAPTVDAQLELYNMTVSKGISVRQIESLVKSIQSQKENSASEEKKQLKKRLNHAYQKVEDDLCSLLESKVNLRPKNDGSGEIVIPYTSDDDLTRIIDLLG